MPLASGCRRRCPSAARAPDGDLRRRRETATAPRTQLMHATVRRHRDLRSADGHGARTTRSEPSSDLDRGRVGSGRSDEKPSIEKLCQCCENAEMLSIDHKTDFRAIIVCAVALHLACEVPSPTSNEGESDAVADGQGAKRAFSEYRALSPPPETKRPLGEDCSDALEDACESALCVNTAERGHICSTRCVEAPCPPGWTCVQVAPSAHAQFCLPEAAPTTDGRDG